MLDRFQYELKPNELIITVMPGDGANNLFDFLEANPQITSLVSKFDKDDLRQYGIDVLSKHFGQRLANNQTITSLNLSDNGWFGSADCGVMADALSLNKTLLVLDMSENAIPPSSFSSNFKSLAQALANNQTLCILNLDGNPHCDMPISDDERNSLWNIHSVLERNRRRRLDQALYAIFLLGNSSISSELPRELIHMIAMFMCLVDSINARVYTQIGYQKAFFEDERRINHINKLKEYGLFNRPTLLNPYPIQLKQKQTHGLIKQKNSEYNLSENCPFIFFKIPVLLENMYLFLDMEDLYKLKRTSRNFFATIAQSTFQFFVKEPDGRTLTSYASRHHSVESLKNVNAKRIGIPAESQRLTFSGWELENKKTLEECKIQSESTISTIVRLRGD